MARRIHILEIKSITVKKFKPLASNQYVCSKEYKKLLEQDFKALEPGIKCVGDITYIHTEECGWTYLATVMGLFDLKIIGLEYSTTMTDDLAVKTLEKAYKARKDIHMIMPVWSPLIQYKRRKWLITKNIRHLMKLKFHYLNLLKAGIII